MVGWEEDAGICGQDIIHVPWHVEVAGAFVVILQLREMPQYRVGGVPINGDCYFKVVLEDAEGAIGVFLILIVDGKVVDNDD